MIMIQRRKFIKKVGLSLPLLALPKVLSSSILPRQSNSPKISLAQWSLNRAFFADELDAKDFAQISSNDYGIQAIEYVSAFYKDEVSDEMLWLDLKKRADDLDVESLLIMVDDEGELGNPDDGERKIAVENHYKWVNAAKLLGCHSIRVNAFGDGSKAEVRQALVDGMGSLSAHAAKEDINIIIENHGLYSSDATFIVGVIKEVNMPNFGTLPDFGNWCLSAKWGSTQIECEQVYDRYQGVSEFMPYAKAVSAKSYNFDSNGDDRIIDYAKMLKVVKETGYDGYIGIEYEGTELSEPEGIRATKALIEKAWSKI
jgi:L-ribulose-5-phosphate 3-epimerase